MKLRWNKSLLLTLFLLAIVALLFVRSLGLEPIDKEVPLVVLSPTLLLIILVLLGNFFPKLLTSTRVTFTGVRQETKQPEVDPTAAGWLVGRKGFLITSSWLIGFCILVALVGFIVAVPIAVLAFFKLFGRQSWLVSLTMSIGLGAILYGVLHELLRFELYKGVLFGGYIHF